MTENTDNTINIRICQVCNEVQSKYCCPRCNVLYCSMICYKSPSHAQCSEDFYKQCFTEELSSMDNDSESKRKMLEILQRTYQTTNSDLVDRASDVSNSNENNFIFENEDCIDIDSDDDESVPDLADRLKDVDLNDSEAVWELLTEDERKEFEALTKDDVAKILPTWQPWWLYRKEKKLVTPIEVDELNDNHYIKLCPSICDDIKPFSNISANKPSPCIKFNILNVLSSYIYTTRLFNGEHHESCKDAATCFISLSSNLSNDTNFDNIEIAIRSVFTESLNNAAFSCDENDKHLLDYDLKCFINGPEESNKNFYLLCAFSDSIILLSNFKRCGYVEQKNKELSKNNFNKKFPESDAASSSIVSKNKVKLIIKKIEYYLSFIKDHSTEIFNIHQ